MSEKIKIKFQGRMKIFNEGDEDIEIVNENPPEYADEYNISDTIIIKPNEDFIFKHSDGEITIKGKI